MINMNSHKRNRLSAIVSWLPGFAVLLICWGPVPAPAEEMKSNVPFFTNLAGQPLDATIRRIYISGSVRIRPEYHKNDLGFGSIADDKYDFVSARYRLGLGAELTSDTNLYIEAQNNSFWGDDLTFGANSDTAGEDNIRIYQAYGLARKIGGSDFSLKVGRQELVYGTEMLLGDADFGPGLSHDALLVNFARGSVSVDAWWAKEVEGEVSLTAPTDPTGRDANFSGVYGKWQPQKGSGVDLYWLFTDYNWRLVAGTPTPFKDERGTVGVRGYYSFDELIVLNAEFAWQYGDTGSPPAENDIRAYALEASAGLNLKDMALSPAFEIGYAFATGDDSPGGTDETFNPLYQDNHPRLGYADLLTLSNLQAYYLKGSIKPHTKYELGAAYYLFWVNKTGDATSPASFSPGTSGGSDTLGQELDVFLNFQFSKHIGGQLTWARLFPGNYVAQQVGSEADSDRVYLHLAASF